MGLKPRASTEFELQTYSSTQRKTRDDANGDYKIHDGGGAMHAVRLTLCRRDAPRSCSGKSAPLKTGEQMLEIERTLAHKKAFRFALLLLLGVIVAVGGVDFARAWNEERVLSKAAREGARIAVSIPLNSPGCDRTPCAIESAAEAVKNSLMNAGLSEASCIAPKAPSFSGILVWVFSCDREATCSASSSGVCLKIDMTAVVVAKDGAWIPSTRVTLEFPHSWTVGSVVSVLPGRLTVPLPKALSADALTANKG